MTSVEFFNDSNITMVSDGPLFCFISVPDRLEFEKRLNKSRGWLLGNVILNAGVPTDLDGYWNRELEFVGSFNDILFFNVGEYEESQYYEYIHWIDSECFAINTHKGQSARDFTFLKGAWEWKRPKKYPKKQSAA